MLSLQKASYSRLGEPGSLHTWLGGTNRLKNSSEGPRDCLLAETASFSGAATGTGMNFVVKHPAARGVLAPVPLLSYG